MVIIYGKYQSHTVNTGQYKSHTVSTGASSDWDWFWFSWIHHFVNKHFLVWHLSNLNSLKVKLILQAVVLEISNIFVVLKRWKNTCDAFVCLFVCLFLDITSHSRMFHSFWHVTINGWWLQTLTFARHSWPLSSMNMYMSCLMYNVYCKVPEKHSTQMTKWAFHPSRVFLAVSFNTSFR